MFLTYFYCVSKGTLRPYNRNLLVYVGPFLFTVTSIVISESNEGLKGSFRSF